MKSVFKSFNKLILPAYSLTKKCMEISLENLYVDIRVQNRGWGGGGTLACYIQWNLDLTNVYLPKFLV